MTEEGSRATFTWLPEHQSAAAFSSSGGGCAVWDCTLSLNIPTAKCRQEQTFQNLWQERAWRATAKAIRPADDVDFL